MDSTLGNGNEQMSHIKRSISPLARESPISLLQETIPGTQPSSQQTVPDTRPPFSLAEHLVDTKTTFDIENDRAGSSSFILPPSSQCAPHRLQHASACSAQQSQSSGIVSPPATVPTSLRRDIPPSATAYTSPSLEQVNQASPDELHSMLNAALAENARLKMETTHHKLQHNLLTLQSDEDAKRAAVEYDMMRREVETLRMTENSRFALRELSAASECIQAKYMQLKGLYVVAAQELEMLKKKIKAAKQIILQKEDIIMSLTDERDLLLNRIRENREHFHMLDKPASTPAHPRPTPRATPKSAFNREARNDRGHGQEMAALLHVLSQENNSAPSTPINANRPPQPLPPKHACAPQLMSSLPTTPQSSRSRGNQARLLPSVDLVPQSGTTYSRSGDSRAALERPSSNNQDEHRDDQKSRESTISAENGDQIARSNEELARQALQSVAAHSYAAQNPPVERVRHYRGQDLDHSPPFRESQASRTASEMLRRNHLRSYEAASPEGHSRNGSSTSTSLEAGEKLQARLFGSPKKRGFTAINDPRMMPEGVETREHLARQDAGASPIKKLRTAGGLRDGGLVGLGIQ